MATFRRVITSFPSSSSSYPYSNTAAQPAPSLSGTDYPHDHQSSPTSPTMRKRQRTLDQPNPADPAQAHQQQPQPVTDDAFIADNDAVDSNAEDDDDDGEKPKSDKKAGRRKIKIEFIQDKSRRHITFSKRKAGIMKKAYELSTLTGTQVLLLVVSETGLVYTFTTAKLQPLVTQPEGKNLIQACLNAPQGSLPSSMPIGPPLSRSQPMNIPSGPPQPTTNNLPGGLSISPSQGGTTIKEDDSQHDEDEEHRAGPKRRRRASTAASGGANVSPRPGQTSPHSPNASIPPPLNIPGQQQGQSQSVQQGNAAQINIGSPTSPNKVTRRCQARRRQAITTLLASTRNPLQHITPATLDQECTVRI
ncbi:transcription factor of the MADS box [Pleurotus ostreatus]|nr:transcription factor of the MADS box [Pleurotus ostreatus]